MPAVASIDGALTPLAAAAVPVVDRGLLFGDQVFEIARAERGWVVDGERHLARLHASAALCRLPPPPPSLADWIAAAVAAAATPHAVVRVVWTGGDADGLARGAGPGRAIVIVEPWTPPAAPPPTRLASVEVDATGRTGALVPAAAKSGSYLGSVIALEAARAAGADDALLVTPDGRALETATASVAVVIAGAVVVADGPQLPGVTLARVCELARADGVTVTTAPLDRATLARADEVFVTSSRRGVIAVAAIDGRALAPGPTSLRLAVRYRAWIDDGAAARGAPPAL